ncbi:MAG: rhodanese-like domain-containing protein [Polyangiaceae bacterium]|nr:rhodanese-like domain-containing protein [Polyangiaceae bacterium]
MPPTGEGRPRDARIPDLHATSQGERMFRVNWVASELRSPSAVPMQSPDYVSRLGRAVRIVDLRAAEELTGPLGYIPGSDWIPMDQAMATLSTLGKDDPVVLVSRGGERAGEIAKALELRGHRFVASMMGGVVAWRQVGFATIRDATILARRGSLREENVHWEASQRNMNKDEILQHLGDPLSIRWIKLAALLVSGRLSCVDGRDDGGVIGTPGGDAGEFLLSLAAVEQVNGMRFDERSLHAMLLRRLDAFGRFYLHTDLMASNTLITALRGDRRFDEVLAHMTGPLEWRAFLASPPESVRSALLDHMVEPDCIGCGHLRLSMIRANEYGVRRQLIEDFLRTFFTLRWEGVDDNEVSVLPGAHAEGAVVNVMLEDGAEAFSRIPLISPMAEGYQMFIHHPQVSSYLRSQLVRFLTHQRDLVPLGAGAEAELMRSLDALGASQMKCTLEALAAGLPVYEVTFGESGLKVESAGEIPTPS